MERLRYISLFSGIGAFEKALENKGIPFELLHYCEVDKYASKAYSLIHKVPESMNLGDITQVDETQLPVGIDLLTYGFPCQDISAAGLQRGMFNEDGTHTRSGLFFEALRIIQHCKSKVAIAENVKNLVSAKFRPQFDLVLKSLDEAGYNNYQAVLNAKDYELPQSRERVIIVSIRKDVDDGTFAFPEPVPLKRCLNDLLEPEVERRYFLSAEQLEKIEYSTFNQEKTRIQNGGGYLPNAVSEGL